MIFSQAVNIKSCIVCFAYQGPNQVTTYFNDNIGHFHKYVYVLDGQIDTEVTPENSSVPDSSLLLLPKQFYDISYTKGKNIKGVTGETGAAMVFFNPIRTEDITVEIIKDKQTLKLKATERISVVCLTGSVEANGKAINQMQFATLPLNKTVTIKIEDGTICAIVTG